MSAQQCPSCYEHGVIGVVAPSLICPCCGRTLTLIVPDPIPDPAITITPYVPTTTAPMDPPYIAPSSSFLTFDFGDPVWNGQPAIAA